MRLESQSKRVRLQIAVVDKIAGGVCDARRKPHAALVVLLWVYMNELWILSSHFTKRTKCGCLHR